MFSYHATTTINATPETIWQILTDATGYPNWDPGIVKMEGTIALGSQLTAYTKRDPKRAFPVTVTEFVPDQRMTWSGGMPLGLFKGVRTFTLTPQANDNVEFTLREEYSGLLLPLIARSIPDLTQTFEEFAGGLKGFAEQASPSSSHAL